MKVYSLHTVSFIKSSLHWLSSIESYAIAHPPTKINSRKSGWLGPLGFFLWSSIHLRFSSWWQSKEKRWNDLGSFELIQALFWLDVRELFRLEVGLFSTFSPIVFHVLLDRNMKKKEKKSAMCASCVLCARVVNVNGNTRYSGVFCL